MQNAYFQVTAHFTMWHSVFTNDVGRALDRLGDGAVEITRGEYMANSLRLGQAGRGRFKAVTWVFEGEV